MHPEYEPIARSATLVHEITHMYVNGGFIEWLEGTSAPKMFGEGFTEYVARIAMSPSQRGTRGSGYQERWDAINRLIARYASDDDIARAYFLGEVWRLESTTDVAQRLFGEQVGLQEGASRREEVSQSAGSLGIVQTAIPGRHYRFMNLAVARAMPKRDHVEAFQQIYAQYITSNPAARLRFVGHASSPGSLIYNLELSRRRSAAFYEMARSEGVTEAQLIDADDPSHEGENLPTATETEDVDVHARAFNRRVELFIEGTSP